MCVCVWLAHDPTIDGLDPSIVVQPRGLHLSLGVLTLATDLDQGEEAGETTHDLAGATQLLAELAPRVHAALGRAPLCMPLCKLTVMQPDPTRAHVLYSEPDLSSTDGRRLRAVCGTLCSPCYLHGSLHYNKPLQNSSGMHLPRRVFSLSNAARSRYAHALSIYFAATWDAYSLCRVHLATLHDPQYGLPPPVPGPATPSQTRSLLLRGIAGRRA